MSFAKRSAVGRESGQAMIEFAGVLVVVTVIVALVAAMGVPSTVLAGVSRSVQNVLTGTSGQGSGTSGQGSAAGGSSGGAGGGGQTGVGVGAGGVAPGAPGGSGAPGGAGANPLAGQVQAAGANAQRLVDAGGDGWGNPSTLARHFADHGGDFGSPGAQAYAQEAQQFLQRAIAERLPMKVGPDGTIRVYDPSTNTFGSYNPDGTTRTYFKPSAGQQYWDRQPGEDPWAEPGSDGGDTGGGSGGDSGGSGGDSGGDSGGGGGDSGGPGGGTPGGGSPGGGDVPAPEPPGLPDIPDIPDIPIVF